MSSPQASEQRREVLALPLRGLPRDAFGKEQPANPDPPPRRSRRGLLIAGSVALIAGALAVAMAIRSKLEPAATVRAVRVERGSIALRIPAVTPGRVTAARDIALRSEVAARVVKVLAHAGDTVSADHALFELDAEELESGVRAAETALKMARASAAEASLRATLARRTAKRGRNLAQRGSVTAVDAEQHEYEARILTQTELVASLQLSEQRERLERAKRAAARSVVRAPIGGLLTSISVVVGEAVTPGLALATISDVSELHVSAQIDESDASRIEVAMPVELRFEGDERPPLRSFVARVDPRVSDSAQGSRVLGIQVALPADFRARLGVGAEVDVLAAERNKVLLIPVSALSRERRDVFVIDEGLATPRPVRTGIIGFTHAEILRGLRQGDLVVENPALAGLSGASAVRWDEARSSAAQPAR